MYIKRNSLNLAILTEDICHESYKNLNARTELLTVIGDAIIYVQEGTNAGTTLNQIKSTT